MNKLLSLMKSGPLVGVLLSAFVSFSWKYIDGNTNGFSPFFLFLFLLVFFGFLLIPIKHALRSKYRKIGENFDRLPIEDRLNRLVRNSSTDSGGGF
ncbi:MAG: hypothetical protein U1F55_11325 [Chitinivorax sp.]|jgi:cbb3-type cytochrome oxidase subunit 3